MGTFVRIFPGVESEEKKEIMIIYLYYIICVTILCSCGNANTRKSEKTTDGITSSIPVPVARKIAYVNSLKMVSPEKNRVYSFGDQVEIRFDVKKGFSLDSSEIFINGRCVAVLGKDERRFSWSIPEGKAGTYTLKIIGRHQDDKQGIASQNIIVKPAQAPAKYGYDIVKVYPHDKKAYTQGLIYHDGYMYEGTGRYGESSIRKTDMNTGKTISILNIDNQLFGEGITIYKDKIYQITWRSRKGFVYDLKTFSRESTFQYSSEGWGITTAKDHLIMSDGSNKLYHIDPSTFNTMEEIEVYDHRGEVNQLNELEYIDGWVWANVWMTDRIVAIDPETGVVKAELDLSDLLAPDEKCLLDDSDDVLNGIAWNPEKKTLYLTGKMWPKLFEIKIK